MFEKTEWGRHLRRGENAARTTNLADLFKRAGRGREKTERLYVCAALQMDCVYYAVMCLILSFFFLLFFPPQRAEALLPIAAWKKRPKKPFKDLASAHNPPN